MTLDDCNSVKGGSHVLGWRDHRTDPADPADPVAHGQPVGTVEQSPKSNDGLSLTGRGRLLLFADRRRPLRRGAFIAAGFANRKGIFHARFPALPLPKPTHDPAISGESLCEQRTHDRADTPSGQRSGTKNPSHFRAVKGRMRRVSRSNHEAWGTAPGTTSSMITGSSGTFSGSPLVDTWPMASTTSVPATTSPNRL